MRYGHRAINLPVVFAYAGLMLGLACAPPRYYDASYSDYHTWNQPEVGFYAQWETQTQRPHQDFSRRSSDDQKAYFNYRHSQDNQKQDNQKQDKQKQDNQKQDKQKQDNRPNN